MRNLDTYNNRMIEEIRNNWLDPDSYFFACKSTNVDLEEEKVEEEYTLSDKEVEQLKQECESDDFNHLDKYDWAELLEEFTGESIHSDDIVKVDLATNTITYLH